MYLLSIASATRSICLQAAYFVPDELAIETFVNARQRGVKIQIIVPGPDMDAKIVQRASRSLWGALLDAGVEIYEHQPTMYHCKVLIVDEVWVSVGNQPRTEFPRPTARAKNFDALPPEAETRRPAGNGQGAGMLSNEQRIELSQASERNKPFLNSIESVWPTPSA